MVHRELQKEFGGSTVEPTSGTGHGDKPPFLLAPRVSDSPCMWAGEQKLKLATIKMAAPEEGRCDCTRNFRGTRDRHYLASAEFVVVQSLSPI